MPRPCPQAAGWHSRPSSSAGGVCQNSFLALAFGGLEAMECTGLSRNVCTLIFNLGVVTNGWPWFELLLWIKMLLIVPCLKLRFSSTAPPPLLSTGIHLQRHLSDFSHLFPHQPRSPEPRNGLFVSQASRCGDYRQICPKLKA